jgi:hypothetical protein
VSEAVDLGSSFHFVGRISRKNDQQLRWVEITGKTETNVRGKRKVVGVVADITVQR